MHELDSENGIGLIEKIRRGLGKPDIIYVKNFAAVEERKPEKEPVDTEFSTEVKDTDFQKSNNFTSGSKEAEPPEVKNFNFKKEKEFTSASKGTELQEVKEFAPNYNNTNYNNQNHTELNYINPINQSESEQFKSPTDAMDNANAYIALIKKNIEYEHHMRYDSWQNKSLYEELFEVICEVVCVKHKTIRIGKEDYPYELVKSKFLKLDSSHLEYVISRMQETTTKVSNIKSYMITALYNAQSTINHFYQQEVQHDMYGGGWNEKGIV